MENNRIHRVKIEPIDLIHARIYQDGEQVHGVCGLDFHLEVNELPSVNLELNSLVEFDGDAVMKIENSSYAIQKAIAVIRAELLNGDYLYDAFLASIESALREQPMPFADEHYIAQFILDRIIGRDIDDEK